MPRDVSELKDFLDCVEHGHNQVTRVVNRLLDVVLPFKDLVQHQLTAVVLQMREYTHHGVVYGICCPVADIQQIRFFDCVNNLLDESLFHSRHLTEQAHLLGVCNPRIVLRVGICAVWNDERTWASQVNKGSGRYDCLLRPIKY